MNSPLKWHGGKSYLAKKIVDLMPDHLHYVEPYAGGLSVLFAKDPEGKSEVVNDLNFGLTTFWRVLRDPLCFSILHRLLEATPFSEQVYKESEEWQYTDDVTFAHAFFIRCRQSLAGRMKTFASVSRNRTRRGMNEQVSAWLTAIEGLPEVHARLKRVLILNRNALDVIQQEDGEKTLFYLDPPYLQETRNAKDVYDHEMTAKEHEAMLNVILRVEGKVMLSGYRSRLYDFALSGWTRHDFDLPNNASGSSEKRRMTECLWCNF